MPKIKIPFGLKPHLMKQGPVLKAHVEVTPTMAKNWLLRNQGNRKKKKTEILFMTNDMRNNKFIYTGEVIIFGKDGNLDNGQNRLHSCVKANKPFTCDITVGVPDEAFDRMDGGAKRTPADVAYTLGISNPSVAGPAAKFVLNFARNESDAAHHSKVRLYQVTSFLEKQTTFSDVINTCMEIYAQSEKPPIGKSTAAGLLWILSSRDWDKALDFITKFLTGGVPSTNPIWLLRKVLFASNSDPEKRIKPTVRLAYIIKTWNAVQSDEKIQRLVFKKNEQFPKII